MNDETTEYLIREWKWTRLVKLVPGLVLTGLLIYNLILLYGYMVEQIILSYQIR